MPETLTQMDFQNIGKEMHDLMGELFPICRSITGPGVRQTLGILQRYIPLKIEEVPSGTRVFDWTIPREWSIRDAFIIGPNGDKIIDFQDNNLHVVGYSIPVDLVLSRDELNEHLYSLPELPDAIPYVTSYYQERWGFCLPHRQRQSLPEGNYHVYIDSTLADGSLTYGELLIPGQTRQEIFLSTYICHPSMANNELSGPVVAAAIAQWIAIRPRRFSYRIIFIPETIGSITYLSRNFEIMKKNVVAGYNLTCMGDDRTFSFLPSRAGNTLADRAALCILKEHFPGFIHYSFLDRGSDERQYCSPGIDLPVASVMRSKYREFPEYHTSMDNLKFVTSDGLAGAFTVLCKGLELLERNYIYRTTCLGEPQLGKYGLYSTLGSSESHIQVKDILNVFSYADGRHDLIDIADLLQIPVWKLYNITDKLLGHGLIVRI